MTTDQEANLPRRARIISNLKALLHKDAADPTNSIITLHLQSPTTTLAHPLSWSAHQPLRVPPSTSWDDADRIDQKGLKTDLMEHIWLLALSRLPWGLTSSTASDSQYARAKRWPPCYSTAAGDASNLQGCFDEWTSKAMDEEISNRSCCEF